MLDANEHLQRSLWGEGKQVLKELDKFIEARGLLRGDSTSAGDVRQKNVYVTFARQLRDIAGNIKAVNDATVLLARDYMPFIDVPDVVGMTQVNAETAIALAGFVSPNVATREDAGPAGLVLQVSPEAGTPFASSRQITIVVSVPIV